MTITIHYDFTDGTEVSYAEGCFNVEIGKSFKTNCLDFFSNDDAIDEVMIIDKLGNELSRNKLMSNKSDYTIKCMREAHNLQKMLKANSFNWQIKL